MERNRDDAGVRDLTALGRVVAGSAEIDGTVRCRKTAARVRAGLRMGRAAVKALQRTGGKTGAAEWLLDNWYAAQQAGREALDSLHGNWLLPAVQETPFTELMVTQYLHAVKNRVEEKSLTDFLGGAGEVRPFTGQELAVLLPTVKAALLMELGSLCGALLSGAPVPETAMESIFASLRRLSSLQSERFFRRVDLLEEIYFTDPAGIYPRMDAETRAAYKRRTARLARRQGISEHALAGNLVKQAAETGEHIGKTLFPENRNSGGLYAAVITSLTLLLALLTGILSGSALAAVLALLPLSELVKSTADWCVLRFWPEPHVPRLALDKGADCGGAALCVISAVLGPDAGKKYARLLERYCIAARDCGANVYFGLLADLPTAEAERMRGDEAALQAAEKEIHALNRKYGPRFFFLHRGRVYSEKQGAYSGWERKRGALYELMLLLRGEKSGVCAVPDIREAGPIRYVITLDSDTRPEPGSLKKLIGAMEHPSNRPVVDPALRRVVRGYGAMQPQIITGLDSAGKTEFSKIMTGVGGTDPYGAAAADVYQSLSGACSFTGKGILDVDAYLACLRDRLPCDTVLSHDLLEGELLRCALVGDAVFSDGHPAGVVDYFRRQHRWVRGDWQNIVWMGRKGPLTVMGRWKIFDNLRRSLMAAAGILSFGLALLTNGPGAWLAAAIWTAAQFFHAVRTLLQEAAGPETAGRRHYSDVLSGAGLCFAQALLRLALLPYETYINLSAAALALVRLKITGRNMLQWTTADEAARQVKNRLGYYWQSLWPCPAAGAVCLAAGMTGLPAAVAAGAVWLLAPALAWLLGREKPPLPEISGQDKQYLREQARAIWKYYEENITKEDHDLPPDNVQVQPYLGRAHRTSPTNIGFALLSCTAAVDLEVISLSKGCETAERLLRAAERLETWNGHLYNWYDTASGTVLSPRYVSTVDSGNLAGCLLAAEAFFRQHGESTLAARAEKLYRRMNFKPLYDESRRLFYIGWDGEKGRHTESWYDLLESEARLTSYIAVARGDVPLRHWHSLSRTLVSAGGYCGMASWTGTMFEYLMPCLLLPTYRNSALYESARFCVEQQIQACPHMPWGISESAYYSFDHSMSYRYKAHGVARLALCRHVPAERIISPYSTFLALETAPWQAMRNLRRLEKLGAVGRYGLYEAVDYVHGSGQPRMVKTFMAHHLGMSMAAIDNAVNGNILQRRLMENADMAAFASLLQERVPLGTVAVRPIKAEAPEKPARCSDGGWTERYEGTDVLRPAMAMMSSGLYSMLVMENGKSISRWGSYLVWNASPLPQSESGGVLWWLETEQGTFPLQPAPVYDGSIRYEARLGQDVCRIMAEGGAFTAETVMQVSSGDVGERREVWVRLGEDCGSCRLLFAMEPVLAPERDFAAHPTYARLSLEAYAAENGFTICRRQRASEGEHFVAVRLSEHAKTEISRRRALGRRGLDGIGRVNICPAEGASPDMYCFGAVELPPHCRDFRLVMAAAPAVSREAAENAALRILQEKTEPDEMTYLDMAARFLGVKSGEMQRYFHDIGAILLGDGKQKKESPVRQEELWSLGLSGDLPIVTVRAEDSVQNALQRVKQHAVLTECGLSYDLAVLTADGGDYRQSQRGAVTEYLRSRGLEWTLGARGGVHILDGSRPGIDVLTSCRRADLTEETEKERNTERKMRKLTANGTGREPAEAPVYKADSEKVMLRIRGKLPPYAWSNVLANERFGYLATETGSGHMWYLNSRENRINSYPGDPLAAGGGETITLRRGEKAVSLFAREDGHPCQVLYGRGYAVWKKSTPEFGASMVTFIPKDLAARVILLELDGLQGEDRLEYCTDLVLGPEEKCGEFLTTEVKDGVFTAAGSWSGDYGAQMFHILCSAPLAAYTGDMDSYLTGRLDGKAGSVRPCAALSYCAQKRMVLVMGCERTEVLRALADYDAAIRSFNETAVFWDELTGRVQIHTEHPALDRYINGWSAYQVIACRLFARTSLYQNGGAFGFRDQLQDVCALLLTHPELAREQLLRSAAHQYAEGDVMHWWHESRRGDKGVRTRCSDDYLWLIYVLEEYVSVTGDWEILQARAPFCLSEPLRSGENERYEHPETGKSATMLEHVTAAAELLLRRGTGAHGLCLMGGGDWNDGMNRVGAGGRGESQWLTWFAVLCMRKMDKIYQTLLQPQQGERYRAYGEQLLRAAYENWNGQWFLRGYYDDGRPLGGAGGDGCCIDSLAQSFAAFCLPGDERVRTALLNAYQRLYHEESGILQLFDPPFDRPEEDPGYIKGYCPGFRENGGQYTHGAVWLAMAMLRCGMEEQGTRILLSLLAENHDREQYAKEPYVLAADVYTNRENYGLGGWTWYTGAAGWMRQAVIRELLGVQYRGGVLRIRPHLPDGFGPCRICLTLPGNRVEITLQGNRIMVDGKACPGGEIRLKN